MPFMKYTNKTIYLDGVRMNEERRKKNILSLCMRFIDKPFEISIKMNGAERERHTQRENVDKRE